MKKFFTAFLITLVFLLIGFQWTSIGKVYAENVRFSGITAPVGCNVGLQPSLNSQTIYSIPGNTNRKVYTTSTGIDGNPTSTPSLYGWATVPEIQQQMSNWCWAATTSAILQHYGLNVNQQQVVFYIKGSLVNQTGTDREMLAAANHFGLYANVFYRLPSYSAVQYEIGNGNPLQTMIIWSTGGGHAQVLDGCYTNGGRSYINIMDPWYGDHFDYAFDYYKGNSEFSWVAYIGNFRRN